VIRRAATTAAVALTLTVGGFALAESFIGTPTGSGTSTATLDLRYVNTAGDTMPDGGLEVTQLRAGRVSAGYVIVDGGLDVSGEVTAPLCDVTTLEADTAYIATLRGGYAKLDGGLDVLGEITAPLCDVTTLEADTLRAGYGKLDGGLDVLGTVAAAKITSYGTTNLGDSVSDEVNVNAGTWNLNQAWSQVCNAGPIKTCSNYNPTAIYIDTGNAWVGLTNNSPAGTLDIGMRNSSSSFALRAIASGTRAGVNYASILQNNYQNYSQGLSLSSVRLVPTGAVGSYAASVADGGTRTGTVSFAAGGLENYGAWNVATENRIGRQNIGVVSLARNTFDGGTEVGAFIGYGWTDAGTLPIYTGAALIVDNSDRPSDIVALRDNGVNVWNLRNGGQLLVNNDAGWAGASLVTVGGAGTTIGWRAPAGGYLYEDNPSGTTIDVEPDAGTWFRWTTATAGVAGSATHALATGAATDTIEIGPEGAGDYAISVSASVALSGAVATQVGVAVFKEGVALPGCVVYLQTATTDKTPVAIACMAALVAADTLDVRVTTDDPARDVVVYVLGFTAQRLGG
jgi:hypothetical protein